VLLNITTRATRLDMASLAARQTGNDGGKGLVVLKISVASTSLKLLRLGVY